METKTEANTANLNNTWLLAIFIALMVFLSIVAVLQLSATYSNKPIQLTLEQAAKLSEFNDFIELKNEKYNNIVRGCVHQIGDSAVFSNMKGDKFNELKDECIAKNKPK